MIRVADFCYRRRRYVLAAWVLVLVGVFVAGAALPAEHRASYKTPGAESTAAYDLLAERFPVRQGDSIKLVFAGDINASETEATIESVVTAVASPYDADGTTRISADGTVAYADVYFDTTFDELMNDDLDFQKNFLDAIDPGQRDGVEVEVTTFIGKVEPGSEFIGLIFAVLILLLAFGSALAMGLPIVTALFGLGVGAVLGGIASRAIETPDWAATIALMIGLIVPLPDSFGLAVPPSAPGVPPRRATACTTWPG